MKRMIVSLIIGVCTSFLLFSRDICGPGPDQGGNLSIPIRARHNLHLRRAGRIQTGRR